VIAIVLAALAICGDSPAAQATSTLLPDVLELSQIEMRLSYEVHGGCVGRCIRYNVTVSGDGSVRYEDVGGEPRDAPHRRTVPVDDVVDLVNRFLRAGFLNAESTYDREPIAVREGNALRFNWRGSADGPEWHLTLKLGDQIKTVRLYRGFPLELAGLRDALDALGGPKSWSKQ
jgi:hypothetical protein